MSLIQVVTGLAVTAAVALLIGKGVGTSLKGLNSTGARYERQLEAQQVSMQLQRDFLRRQPWSERQIPVPQVFSATSGCKDLKLGQTILNAGTRTIDYKTVCDGPEFTDADSRNAFFSGLSDQCRGRPRVRVVTTQPDGKTSERVYPTRSDMDAAVLCVHPNQGFSSSIAADLVLGQFQGGRWKTTVKAIQLGLEGAGAGIEIIPPQ